MLLGEYFWIVFQLFFCQSSLNVCVEFQERIFRHFTRLHETTGFTFHLVNCCVWFAVGDGCFWIQTLSTKDVIADKVIQNLLQCFAFVNAIDDETIATALDSSAQLRFEMCHYNCWPLKLTFEFNCLAVSLLSQFLAKFLGISFPFHFAIRESHKGHEPSKWVSDYNLLKWINYRSIWKSIKMEQSEFGFDGLEIMTGDYIVR